MSATTRTATLPPLDDRLPQNSSAEAIAPSTPSFPRWTIVGGAVLCAAVCGRFLADGHMKLAAALVLGAMYAPLCFFYLPAAFALWTAVQFVRDIHGISVGPNTMGLLVALAFLGTLIPRLRTLPVLRQQRRLLLVAVLSLLWSTLSIAWAEKPGTAASGVGYWALALLALLITVTALKTPRDISLVAVAFVVGASVAAVIGLASGGLSSAASRAAATTSSTVVQGRLTGGGGDPNLQAAGFIAAMFLATGLMSFYRRRLARLALIAAFLVITAAFFATQSRGGLLALAVATAAALAISPRQRRRILALASVTLVIAGVAVALSPGSLGRITNFGGGTSGRSDIWIVATKVFEQHPLAGVGVANFEVVEPRFSLALHRSLSRVTYIAETPQPAHNSYLQLLVDQGIIGLALYLLLAIGCLRAGWVAARVFDRNGQYAAGHLARAALMAAVGMLLAVFFITDYNDSRLWILLGLGPALLALARSPISRERVAVPGSSR